MNINFFEKKIRLFLEMGISLYITLAPPRGIGVTLNPKGGQNYPTSKKNFFVSFQGVVDLFLFRTLQKGKKCHKN